MSFSEKGSKWMIAFIFARKSRLEAHAALLTCGAPINKRQIKTTVCMGFLSTSTHQVGINVR